MGLGNPLTTHYWDPEYQKEKKECRNSRNTTNSHLKWCKIRAFKNHLRNILDIEEEKYKQTHDNINKYAITNYRESLKKKYIDTYIRWHPKISTRVFSDV